MISNIVRQLADRRRELGMTYSALAARSGVSEPTVNRTLNGRSNPSLSVLLALAGAMGVELKLSAEPAQSFREREAKEKARRLVSLTQGTMALEAQAMEDKTIKELERWTVHKLMADSPRRLWAS